MAPPVRLEMENGEMTAFDIEGRRVGTVLYRDEGETWDFLYTEVFPEYRMHGFGEAITRAAFAQAATAGVLVHATCGFMRGVALRDPELKRQLASSR